MNYFKIICYVWAFIGIGSRIIMGMMGEKWKEWELNSAYKPKKPAVVNIIGVFAYLIVIYTWYMALTTRIEFSWIITLLVSVTVIKISAIMFNYTEFRNFASKTLNDRQKMFRLNLGVIIYSASLILMGAFLY